ncbi:SRPBCC family protein [Chitinophaga rhizosphaerae]|uniref:SRPBCC family protein n=1 Tax=Chitinophaga rhizosphaerae TaxID=1864947 RepID=UPI000F80C1A3|nr:SRPBCC family protein [Chitinophaga rhizosphaerae]
MHPNNNRPRAGTLYEKSTVINVSKTGRMLSSAAGASLIYLALSGMKRSPVKNIGKLLVGGYLLYRGLSGNCPITAAIDDEQRPKHARAVNIRTSLIVERPRGEVYAYWRQLSNLPLFMAHLDDVEVLDTRLSHWTIKLAGNMKLEWDAEITEDKPGEELAWRSLEGAEIANAGKVRFRDTENGGTEILVTFTYRPPAGFMGAGLARLMNPAFAQLVRHDIIRFKQHLEEVPAPDNSGRG